MAEEMAEQTYLIKSLHVQNGIMLFSLGLVLLFFAWALVKKRHKHAIASLIWVGIVLWFFNSAYFGFSAITVGPAGMTLNYGILSFRNDHFPIDSPWRIKTDFSDIRKLKRVYMLDIAGRESMKVKAGEGLARLKEIGRAIDRAKKSGGSPPVR